MLGIEHPILLAGMGSSSGPSLVAAVSNAGGLGVLGAAALSPDTVRRWIRKTKSLTDKPFGLDLILPHEMGSSMTIPQDFKEILPPDHVAFVEKLREELELPKVEAKRRWANLTMEVAREVVDICLDEGLVLFASGLGNPGWVVPKARERGMLVTGCVGNTKNAVRLQESGVDFVIAQGHEGGGHTGRIGTMALIPQVIDAVDPLPVVAAGGIVDGRGLAAALTLGAEGVWLGTAFLATAEANADALEEEEIYYTPFWDKTWKELLIGAVDEDTKVSKIATGKTARYVRNKLIDYWDKSGVSYLPMPLQGLLVGDLFAAIAKSGKRELVSPYAGQGAGLIKKIRTPAEIIEDMVQGALEILSEKVPQRIGLK
jgi:NAD(P)H-dependent flavin oxidoreductase YrpB (nitropropane dioxygenase family)